MIAIKQVDLAPTIALLLGVPVPYGNLGAVISELFSKTDRQFLHETKHIENMRRLCEAEMLNAAQIQRYLTDYSERTRQFPAGKMTALRESYEKMSATVCSKTDTLTFHEHYLAFHREASDMCEDLWTTFDTQGMVLGGALMVASVLSLLHSLTFTTLRWRAVMVTVALALLTLPVMALFASFSLAIVGAATASLIALHYFSEVILTFKVRYYFLRNSSINPKVSPIA